MSMDRANWDGKAAVARNCYWAVNHRGGREHVHDTFDQFVGRYRYCLHHGQAVEEALTDSGKRIEQHLEALQDRLGGPFGTPTTPPNPRNWKRNPASLWGLTG